jgi:hypothetical protein
MTKRSHVGWLYSLAKDSNWGHVECFDAYLETKEDPIIIDSKVWGRKRRSEFDPRPGDGFALYHSQRAEFAPGDPFQRKPRISVIGKLLDIESDGAELSWLKISVDPNDLRALTQHPIVRDDSTQEIFKRCEIVPGFPASLYRADHATWGEILALLKERKERLTGSAHLTRKHGKK